jgi:hypothetical protein
MKITKVILSALLLLLAAGCKQEGADNASNTATNAPATTNSTVVDTNAAVSTNK